MRTYHGPIAKNGDFVLVTNVYGAPTTIPALVFHDKAYTGQIIGSTGRKFLHRMEAEIVIPESYVSEKRKELIRKDIALSLCKKIGKKEGSFYIEQGLAANPTHYCMDTRDSVYAFLSAEALLLYWHSKLQESVKADWSIAVEFIEKYLLPIKDTFDLSLNVTPKGGIGCDKLPSKEGAG